MKNILLRFAIILPLTLLVACQENATQLVQKPIGVYKVLQLKKSNTTLLSTYPAKLEGVMDVDIRPKIDGYIEQIYVEEGEKVRKGQMLFKINNPQYSQDVQGYSASISATESAVSIAKLQVDKTKPLVEQGIISAFELRNAELNLEAKKAELARVKSQYQNALVNQGYTMVKSPVDGYVGTIPYKIGSYVNSATAQALTRISDISTVFAYFSMNEKQQLNYFSQKNDATFEDVVKNIDSVIFIMSSGTKYPLLGKIQTFSGQVNASTGTFNVRAQFNNPNQMLRSGNSGNIQIPTYLENVIIIPQKATLELQDKRVAFVFFEGKVKSVPIKVRPVPGGEYFVVDEGLTENDLLIIEGIGILTEGTEIQADIKKFDDLINEN